MHSFLKIFALLSLAIGLSTVRAMATDCADAGWMTGPGTLNICSETGAEIPWESWFDALGAAPDTLTSLEVLLADGSVLNLLPGEVWSLAPQPGLALGETWWLTWWTGAPNAQPQSCTSQLEVIWEVPAVAGFDIITTTSCADVAVEFDLVPDAELSYFWDFGDGQTSEAIQPAHMFDAPVGIGDTTYTVELTITTPGGCLSSASQMVTVDLLPDLGFGEFEGLPPLCTLSDDFPQYEVELGGEGVQIWSVDWGNGSPPETYPGSATTATTTFDVTYGEFTIAITGEGANGCINSYIDDMYVGSTPTIGTASPGSVDGVCSPIDLTFPILGWENNDPSTMYSVTFGDGSSAGSFPHNPPFSPPPTVTHTYVNSSCGFTTPEGSGNAFRFRVQASNGCGTSNAYVDPIRIHNSVNPWISGPGHACHGTLATYHGEELGEVLSPTDCNYADAYWDAAAGSGQAAPAPDAGTGLNWTTYLPEPGWYNVGLFADHAVCVDGNASYQTCVYPPLTALADFSPVDGCLPLDVSLNDISPDPPLCGQHVRQWSISGGDFDWISGWYHDVAPVVRLYDAGTYTITLTTGVPGTNFSCNTDTHVFTIEVYEAPEILVSTGDMFGPTCEDEDYMVSIWDLYDGNAPSVEWVWEVDDVEVDENTYNITHYFDDPGFHFVECTATNLCGTDVSGIPLNILPIPEAVIVTPPVICAEDTIPVVWQGPVSFVWSADPPEAIVPGSIDEGQLEIIADGTVELSAELLWPNGCTSTETHLLTPEPLPIPILSQGPTSPLCPGEIWDFMGSVAEGDPQNFSYAWWLNGTGEGGGEMWSLEGPEEAGTHWITLEATSSVGCVDTIGMAVEVPGRPAVDAGADTSICNAGLDWILWPVEPPLGGTWQGIDGAAGLIAPDGTVEPALLPTGLLEFEYEFVHPISGCWNADTIAVQVDAPVQAFVGPDLVSCGNVPAVDFEGFGPLGEGVWSAPDPFDAAVLDADLGYIDPQVLPEGTHVFTFTVGAGNCATEATAEIEIVAPPTMTPAAPQSFCENAGLQTLASPTPLGGVWTSGNGLQDADLGTFDATGYPGSYIYEYSFEDSLTGCTGTAEHEVTLIALPDPNFDLPDFECAGVGFSPTDLTSNAQDYTWDFGSGGVFNASNPVVMLDDLGMQVVELTIESPEGCEASRLDSLEIIGVPLADFTLSVTEGCAPLEVDFANSSTGAYPSYAWDLGGVGVGSTNMATPPVTVFNTFNDTATFAITLTVTNPCGTSVAAEEVFVATPPDIAFVLPADTVCSPFTWVPFNASTGWVDSWAWDFGNGEGSEEENPGETDLASSGDAPESFNITLTGTNFCGSFTDNATLVVQPTHVTAFFTAAPAAGCAPLDVTLTDYSLAATDVSYDFGNGTFGNLTPVQTVTFSTPGTYSVWQTVGDGCTADSMELTIDVAAPPPALLTADANVFCAGATAEFEVLTGMNPAATSWLFDGVMGSGGLSASHVFGEPGDFWVHFDALEALTGCEVTDSIEVTVLPQPAAALDMTDAGGCSPLEVQFLNVSNGGAFATWTFGDGSAAVSGDAPIHTFDWQSDAPANFQVTLSVTDGLGCSGEADTVVTVWPQPEAAFDLLPAEVCGAPAEVVIANNSAGAVAQTWSWTGGASTSDWVPAGWLAPAVGSYEISLEVVNGWGCSDADFSTFTLHPLPLPELVVEPFAGCAPLTIDFTDLTTGASTTELVLPGVYTGDVPDFLTFETPGSHVGHLEATSDDGCVVLTPIEEVIQVWPTPVANFLATPQNPIDENTVYHFENTSTTDFLINWDFGDGGFSTDTAPTHDFVNHGLYNVQLDVENEWGCTASIARFVDLGQVVEVFAPSAFTPPSESIFADGINDGWRPEIHGREFLTDYHLQIFDRWGSMVFESRDPDAYWTGEFQPHDERSGGYFARSDVYSWRLAIRLEGEATPSSGRLPRWDCDDYRSFCGIVTLLTD
jgi:PKD repeat protein